MLNNLNSNISGIATSMHDKKQDQEINELKARVLSNEMEIKQEKQSLESHIDSVNNSLTTKVVEATESIVSPAIGGVNGNFQSMNVGSLTVGNIDNVCTNIVSANQVGANKGAFDEISAATVSSDSIVSSKVASQSVGADSVEAGNVNAQSANIGEITTSKIEGVQSFESAQASFTDLTVDNITVNNPSLEHDGLSLVGTKVLEAARANIKSLSSAKHTGSFELELLERDINDKVALKIKPNQGLYVFKIETTPTEMLTLQVLQNGDNSIDLVNVNESDLGMVPWVTHFEDYLVLNIGASANKLNVFYHTIEEPVIEQEINMVVPEDYKFHRLSRTKELIVLGTGDFGTSFVVNGALNPKMLSLDDLEAIQIGNDTWTEGVLKILGSLDNDIYTYIEEHQISLHDNLDETTLDARSILIGQYDQAYAEVEESGEEEPTSHQYPLYAESDTCQFYCKGDDKIVWIPEELRGTPYIVKECTSIYPVTTSFNTDTSIVRDTITTGNVDAAIVSADEGNIVCVSSTTVNTETINADEGYIGTVCACTVCTDEIYGCTANLECIDNTCWLTNGDLTIEDSMLTVGSTCITCEDVTTECGYFSNLEVSDEASIQCLCASEAMIDHICSTTCFEQDEVVIESNEITVGACTCITCDTVESETGCFKCFCADEVELECATIACIDNTCCFVQGDLSIEDSTLTIGSTCIAYDAIKTTDGEFDTITTKEAEVTCCLTSCSSELDVICNVSCYVNGDLTIEDSALTVGCTSISCDTVESTNGCFDNLSATCAEIACRLVSCGDVYVTGNIYQQGESYVTHAEDLKVKDNNIELREDATTALQAGEYSGIKVIKYDGEHDSNVVVDGTGTLRVGDDGDEKPVTLHAETMDDGNILRWDGTNNIAITTKISASDIQDLICSSEDVFCAVCMTDAASCECPATYEFTKLNCCTVCGDIPKVAQAFFADEAAIASCVCTTTRDVDEQPIVSVVDCQVSFNDTVKAGDGYVCAACFCGKASSASAADLASYLAKTTGQPTGDPIPVALANLTQDSECFQILRNENVAVDSAANVYGNSFVAASSVKIGDYIITVGE